MATYVTPTRFTPTATSAWTDLDVSSIVPAGSSGVIFHALNNSAGALAFGMRMNGSADNRTANLAATHHGWGVIGVDSSRICEAFVGSTSSIVIRIIGYFATTDAVFFTNGADKSAATTGGWGDVAIATDTTGSDVAIAACFEITEGSTTNWGIRKNGSADALLQDDVSTHVFGVVGVDASEIFEQQIAGTAVDLFLTGYIMTNAVLYTNTLLRTATAASAWVDLTAVGSTSTDARTRTGGIYQLTTNTVVAGMRFNGSTATDARNTKNTWSMPQVDASNLVEAFAVATSREFREMGFFTADATASASATATATATGAGESTLRTLALTGIGRAIGGIVILPSVPMPWAGKKVA